MSSRALLDRLRAEIAKIERMPPLLAAGASKALLKPLGDLLEEIINDLEKLHNGDNDQA